MMMIIEMLVVMMQYVLARLSNTRRINGLVFGSSIYNVWSAAPLAPHCPVDSLSLAC
jgi:hypothetical protein